MKFLILALLSTAYAAHIECRDYYKYHSKYSSLDWVEAATLSVEAFGTDELVLCLGIKDEQIKRIHVYDKDGSHSLFTFKQALNKDYPIMRYKDLSWVARLAMKAQDVGSIKVIPSGPGHYRWEVKIPSTFIKGSDGTIKLIEVDVEITRQNKVILKQGGYEFNHIEPMLNSLKLASIDLYRNHSMVISRSLKDLKNSNRCYE